MKIKHIYGYGTVNAKKVSLTPNRLVVHVWGNHERGIEFTDPVDVFDWLVKRFDRKRTSWWDIADIDANSFYSKDEHGVDIDHCIYSILFRN